MKKIIILFISRTVGSWIIWLLPCFTKFNIFLDKYSLFTVSVMVQSITDDAANMKQVPRKYIKFCRTKNNHEFMLLHFVQIIIMVKY